MSREETRQLFYKLQKRVIYPNEDWKRAFSFYNEYMPEKAKMNRWIDYSQVLYFLLIQFARKKHD
jgi:hypothetical protein